MPRIRHSGPMNVTRPSIPTIGVTDTSEQIAEALDRIAVTLAAIDHNLEFLAASVKGIAHKLR